MSNEIYRSVETVQIEKSVFKFLLKFSTYFEKEKVLENGLKNIVYSNKSARKNVSSKLLVHIFKPLLMQDEENKYIQYDFSNFNVEHIINDDFQKDITYSLGNLLLCPRELNSIMKDCDYIKKREKLLASNIPYLKKFAEKYEEFNERDIEVRTQEIIQEESVLYW